MVLETAEFVRVLELVVDSGVGSLPLVLVVDLGVADAVVDADQRLVGQRTGTVDRRLVVEVDRVVLLLTGGQLDVAQRIGQSRLLQMSRHQVLVEVGQTGRAVAHRQRGAHVEVAVVTGGGGGGGGGSGGGIFRRLGVQARIGEVRRINVAAGRRDAGRGRRRRQTTVVVVVVVAVVVIVVVVVAAVAVVIVVDAAVGRAGDDGAGAGAVAAVDEGSGAVVAATFRHVDGGGGGGGGGGGVGGGSGGGGGVVVAADTDEAGRVARWQRRWFLQTLHARTTALQVAQQ